MRWFALYLLLPSSNEAFVRPSRPKFASHGSSTALPIAIPSPEQQPSPTHERTAAGVAQLASWLLAENESAESRVVATHTQRLGTDPLWLMKQTEEATAVETLQSEAGQAADSALRLDAATPETPNAALAAKLTAAETAAASVKSQVSALETETRDMTVTVETMRSEDTALAAEYYVDALATEVAAADEMVAGLHAHVSALAAESRDLTAAVETRREQTARRDEALAAEIAAEEKAAEKTAAALGARAPSLEEVKARDDATAALATLRAEAAAERDTWAASVAGAERAAAGLQSQLSGLEARRSTSHQPAGGLAPGWTEHHDAESGKPFFHHAATKVRDKMVDIWIASLNNESVTVVILPPRRNADDHLGAPGAGEGGDNGGDVERSVERHRGEGRVGARVADRGARGRGSERDCRARNDALVRGGDGRCAGGADRRARGHVARRRIRRRRRRRARADCCLDRADAFGGEDDGGGTCRGDRCCRIVGGGSPIPSVGARDGSARHERDGRDDALRDRGALGGVSRQAQARRSGDATAGGGDSADGARGERRH